MRSPFSPIEDKFLKENYLTIPAKQLSRILGRAEGTSRQRLKILGLTIPDHIKKIRAENSRFKKGIVPYSKGKKWDEYISPEAQKKSLATAFKKGNTPHNTLHDGAITVRRNRQGIQYQFIRISVNKWEFLHRIVWQHFNGKIPTSSAVVFKDGNQGNCNIENLELVSRKKLMERNTIHNYPSEIKCLIRLQSALVRKINKRLKALTHEK